MPNLSKVQTLVKKQSWPPDYKAHIKARGERFNFLLDDIDYIEGAKEYYKKHPAEFIEHWAITYDPRKAVKGLPHTMPFVLFERQKEFIQFLYTGQGSLSELDTQITICRELGFLSDKECGQLSNQIEEESKMIGGLIKSLRKKIN